MSTSGSSFETGHVEAGGVSVPYLDAGEGPVLVHLRGATGGEQTPAHDLLAGERRVVAFDVPGAGEAPEVMLRAISDLGIDRFDLMATSLAARTAVGMAVAGPERVSALVLESPDGGPELERALPLLQVPVLAVFGTRDMVLPPEAGRRCKQLLPGCQLLYVYDAGHSVATDRPEAFTEAVADFLAHQDQYVVSRRTGMLFPR
jgi:pimeloyl-ACP methyl ester carboxylesterase